LLSLRNRIESSLLAVVILHSEGFTHRLLTDNAALLRKLQVTYFAHTLDSNIGRL